LNFNGLSIGGHLGGGLPINTISGGSTPPSLSSCGTSPTLTGGSSDIYGEIYTGAGAGSCTLSFAMPWTHTPGCILTDDGQAYLWYTSNKSNSAVTFNCIVPSTGAACSGNQFVQYNCGGIGGL
jgi:hypothetical protein